MISLRIRTIIRKINYWYIFSLLTFLGFLLFWFSLPQPLFSDPACTVLTDKNGDLLAATIASDGQYRFPYSDSIPDKFKKCIIAFEDRFFYRHPGVNPLSILRAVDQNIREGKIVSGGSTISMQVIRLSRKNRERTIVEKVKEIILALRLEVTFSKEQVIGLYASHAPFGGNVVGIEAASWRYFGRKSSNLSWAETASLAVLPNAPSMIFPGKNKELYLKKRNKLLKKMMDLGEFDSTTYSLAIQEPLPEEPKPLPQIAPHLLTRAILDGFSGSIVKTTINPYLQTRVNEIVEQHKNQFMANSIHNAAVLVIDVETGNVDAYIGNTKSEGTDNGNSVDIIRSPRSTGSILKPFLYCAMLNEGIILPNTLIPDIPTQIGGYTPKNYYPDYDGAVPASRALARSLNVPAVRMLQTYGVEKFHFLLNKIGLSTVNRPSGNYGLSLILGGAEATLWDLSGVYSSLGRTLNHFRQYESRYDINGLRPPSYINRNVEDKPVLTDQTTLGAASIYLTFEAMREVARPDEQAGWKYFSSTRSVAWKTGTSYGHRDAWAIGLNPQYVVAVWVGNASGEGRPDLTGISVAAPIMFDVFGLLPSCGWFDKPYDDMIRIATCRQSGHVATENCLQIDSIWIPNKSRETSPCPYHRLIHLDQSGKFRVTDNCLDVSKMQHQSWFILPPAMEWFYKTKNPEYRTLPPFASGCQPDVSIRSMALIYPRIANSRIQIPIDIDGKQSETIFEVVHRRNDATIFWHLDDLYMGSTKTFHKMGLVPSPGKHTLTLVDDNGETLVTRFDVSGK